VRVGKEEPILSDRRGEGRTMQKGRGLLFASQGILILRKGGGGGRDVCGNQKKNMHPPGGGVRSVLLPEGLGESKKKGEETHFQFFPCDWGEALMRPFLSEGEGTGLRRKK